MFFMIKKYFLLAVALLCVAASGFSQEATVKGVIYNGTTKETIPGVSVMTSDKTGVSSEIDGSFTVKVHSGKAVRLVFKILGYANVTKLLDIKPGETKEIKVEMMEQATAIEGVVVTAGKFEQKFSDVTISMDVLKPNQIENRNTNNITSSLNKVSGVDINDNQPSIRGGSGYSYGAGSRVMVLVDDLPMLSPDGGDSKWNYLPLENLSQVEIIKGASSALFGSSALNGVINLRTAYPKSKPETKISVNSGLYLNPKNRSAAWWYDSDPLYSHTVAGKMVNPLSMFGVKNPGFGGLNFFHSRQIGQFDLVVGGNLYENQGFQEDEGEARARANINFRYRAKKIEGLSLGFNANYMYQDKKNFFLWKDSDSGIYRQNNPAVPVTGYRINVDPYFLYFNKRGSKYTLKTRYYRQTNHNADSTMNNDADIIYADYQYQHKFKDKYNLTAGAMGSYSKSTALLYQTDHHATNAAIYIQFDAKVWKRVSFSLGLRGEYARIDKDETESSFSIRTKKDTFNFPIEPVLRAGINVQAAEYTFVRASFGQGYRFPSIAEKFIRTSIGGLNIFPNPDLNAESGWSAEIGLKQGFRVGSWLGYFDVAAFWIQYKNMMEFTFDDYRKDGRTDTTYTGYEDYIKKFLGFKSLNVGHARIAGVDVSLMGKGLLFGFPATLGLSYIYTDPVNLDYDATDTNSFKVLKYRNYHTIKGDFEVQVAFFTLGLSYIYKSHIINIDKAFEGELIPGISKSNLLPGLKQYRTEHDKGYHVLDLRMLFDINKQHRIGLFVNNLFNTEYMTRPGYIEAPINVAVQYMVTF